MKIFANDLPNKFRHPREGEGPVFSIAGCPPDAGMTVRKDMSVLDMLIMG
ncbi:MAG: hypothetical protein OEY94_08870 [Alphaproteobacteria bacterium]|nr:hypothetical protein [Alphaproteobacteria bacterium]